LSLEVGVFGATGYAGREVVRCLAQHPRARVRFTTGTGEAHLPHEEGLSQPADAYFLSMPHGVSARYAAQLQREHPEAIIIDLSGDLRLPDAASYRSWYGHDHPAPEAPLFASTTMSSASTRPDATRGSSGKSADVA
jgi:N-acetyl-gamma-glutamylphosphate reductase